MILMNSSSVLLHLSLIEGIGSAAVQLLIEKKPASWQWNDLYKATMHDLIECCDFSVQRADSIVSGLKNKDLLEQELHVLERHSIKWTTVLNDDYPSLLKHIHLPPTILYWKGMPLDAGEKSIAVVGSRSMNWYGKKAIDVLIPSLVEYGWTIVSGGAIGADSYAHCATINAHGKTVVVLGSGLFNPYPVCNKSLFEAVVGAGGTIVSPFALDTVARPGNFPARNRIIAGLSRGCVIVQAARKSGACITANFALEQGRDVFAVPGPIDDELSAGCHALIKEGAKLVHSVEDILEEYGSMLPQAEKTRASLKLNKKQIRTMGRSQIVDNDPVTVQIVTNCSIPTTLDELSVMTGLPFEALHERLFNLQLQGVVCQQMGLWKRC